MLATCRTPAVVLAAVVALALAATPRAAASETSARKYLEQQKVAKTILFFAHPEATYRSLTYKGTGRVTDTRGNLLRGAFALHYDYAWKSGLSGDTNTTRIRFLFLADGSVEVQSTVKDTTSWITPFSTADLVLAALKKEMLKNPKLANDRVFVALIKKGDTKRILGFLIQLGHASQR